MSDRPVLAHRLTGSESGPPVLLLNGGMMSIAAWEPVASRLEPDYRVRLVANGQDGLHLGLAEPWDVMVIDRGLPILDGLALRPWFDAVVDGGMVTKGKPDPETFLLLADALKVAPARCVVFEDSLLGEEAARRAGMKVVAITTSHRADEFRWASVKAPDFLTLKPSAIAALLPPP